jgi:dTMP kinase
MAFPRNTYDGKLIVIEGIDGAGLSTQTAAVKEALEHEGHRVCKTKEPTDGPAGAVIRLALTHRISLTPHSFALLFAADRMDHLHNEIMPELEKGTTVICDRYFFSNLAYQGTELERAWIKELNRDCLLPDATFFLDVDPHVSEDRMRVRHRAEYFENRETLARIREEFIDVLSDFETTHGAHIRTIRGDRAIMDVTRDIVSDVLELL